MTYDDTLIRRRILAVQAGLLLALLLMVAGPEAVDLTRSASAQLPVLLAVVGAALLVEHRTRPRAVTAGGY